MYSSVLDRYGEKHRDSIKKRLIKEYGAKEISDGLNAIAKKASSVNAEAEKISIQFKKAMEKLESEKETELAKIRSEKMLPILEEYEKYVIKVRKNEEIYFRYPYDLRVRPIEKNISEEEEEESTYCTYPAINIANLVNIRPEHFISDNTVSEELQEIMKPAKHEFKVAELKLNSMEEAIREVMLFDESRMNEAFQKLFEFRNSVHNKYLELIEDVKSEELEEVEI